MPSRTTQLTILAAVGLGIAACESPSEPRISGACIGVTNVGGTNFTWDAELSVSERVFNQGEVVGTVTRRRRCRDTLDPVKGSLRGPEDLVPFEAGDSNMYPVGTKFCAIVGESPESLVMLCDRPPSEKRILKAAHDL